MDVRLALLALVVAAGTAAAASQPASSYPAAFGEIGHTLPDDALQFEVFATFAANITPTAATAMVCHFRQAADAEPDLCYNPVPMTAGLDGRFVARTAKAGHPGWEAGAALGYKVLAQAPGGEVQAPTNGTYYRLTLPGQRAPAAAPGPDAAVTALAVAAVAVASRGRPGA